MAEKNGSPAGSSFWQIIFPALIGFIIILLICVWLVINISPGNLSRFAEISTVLLVLPVLFFSLIIMLILAAAVILVIRLIRGIPPITNQILEFLSKIQDGVRKISQLIVNPVIQPARILGGIRSLLIRKKSRYRIE
ncbi:MAG: hypothetical protein KAS84_01705 [Anaerolineales bacterium]|nr:hypothetical protein [Anaerolineales bacterium]